MLKKLIKMLNNLVRWRREFSTEELAEADIPIVTKTGRLKYLKKTLKLTLDRVYFTPKSTIGELSIDGKFECYILEDYDRLSKSRRKVHGQTAIPRGTYEVKLTYSPRFKRTLPLLTSIPGFTGIRINAGNTARDTEGCLLPGITRSKNFVGQSKRAFNKLYKKLTRAKSQGKRIIIEVV